MAGGLLNIVSYGQENIIIYGNPKKSYFLSTFKTITNFGMQKFRIDFDGQKVLRYDTDTIMEFKIPRYADLFGSTYVVMNLPDIWSPIVYDVSSQSWVGYEYKWIENLGANMIKELEVTIGGQTICKYSGEYFANVAERDLNGQKKELWDNMSGNIPELNDPANAYDRVNSYPHAYNPNVSAANIRPSILGRKLYIPLMCWFTSTPAYAIPLVALQYQEVRIKVTFRPIRELYIIRDVEDPTYNFPYLAPNSAKANHQIYNFINPPLDSSNNVASTFNNWDSDIHLMSTYYFLDEREQRYFAERKHSYLFKSIYEWDILNISGPKTVNIESLGLVTNYMFRFRRSDAFMRNVWSNYTNWPYENVPFSISNDAGQSPSPFIFTTGFYDSTTQTLNTKTILNRLGLLFEGKYRENLMDAGVYNYIEKFDNTDNCVKDGLYMYSFEMNTNHKNHQPSGAINTDQFDVIQFELDTIIPPNNPNATYTPICDADGNEIGTRKNLWQLKEYNFDLRIFEERYNVLEIQSGMGGLKIAR
jgi:hypothetical protein